MKLIAFVVPAAALAACIPDAPYAGPKCQSGTCQLDANTAYVVNVTDGHLRSEVDAITFNTYRNSVIDAFDHAPGADGVSLRIRGLEIATVSIWDDEASLMTFASSGPHSDAEVGLATSITSGFFAVHWTQQGSELPLAFDDALARATSQAATP